MRSLRFLIRAALALAVAPAFAEGDETPLPKEPANLDFEAPLEGSGWATKFDGKAEFDESLHHAGGRSLRLSGPATRLPVEKALTQPFDATGVRGRRVEVSGWVRYDKSRIGLWVSAGAVSDCDREGKRQPAASEEPQGWKRLVARIEVPYDAEAVTIGARIYLEEGAPVWIDDLAFRVCDDATPLFGPTLIRANFANLDFERPAAEGESPPEWRYEATSEGDPLDDYDDTKPSVYEFVRDEGSPASGSACGRLAHLEGPRSSATVWQSIGAAPWRGKKVRFSVYLRWEKVDLPQEGPFLEVNSWTVRLGAAELEWGESDLPGWRRAEFTIDIPAEAEKIIIGFRISLGTLWMDRAEFRAVE